MPSTNGDGPDTVELTSGIATWIAAVVALVALLGVIGPFLAFQASISDYNRAMNAVQDVPQKYISRGLHIRKGLRIMRRIRVPDLSPGYIANQPDIPRLIPPEVTALGHWTLRPREYMLWNTGWAKLAELIDAYEVKDSRSNESLSLGLKASAGTLEVVNSRTALVVNKHWILLLGLLGVYGQETKKGILQTGTRNDFAEEQAPIRNFAIVHAQAAVGMSGHFERRAREQKRRRQNRPVVTELFEPDSTDNNMRTASMSFRRSAYGEWTLESQRMSSIRGMTGTMRTLGRHRGSWSFLSAVSFVPHSARQMFKAQTQEKKFLVPISTSFWLAYGFIPCGRAPKDRETVISLESPARRIMDSYPSNKHLLGWTVFSLTESDDLPVSIGHAMMHLGIAEPRILQFLPATPSMDLVSEDHQVKIVDHIKNMDPSDDVLEDGSPITADDTFVYRYENEWSGYLVFPLRQFERVLSALISLEWDDWGLLTWREDFWISVLNPIVRLQSFSAKEEKAFGAALGHTTPVPGFRVPPTPASLPHFIHLDKLIQSL
jgi:hypothetical protein